MKSIADINQQMSKVQSAIMALNAMNTTVQSVMIAGSKPVIRIARNGHLKRGELFKIDLQLIQDNQKRHNGELFKIKFAVV
ncbi:hypothetical protein H6H41_004779 [Salmonella enterica]|nr:hypothetical protein [Salmonella enterica]